MRRLREALGVNFYGRDRTNNWIATICGPRGQRWKWREENPRTSPPPARAD